MMDTHTRHLFFLKDIIEIAPRQSPVATAYVLALDRIVQNDKDIGLIDAQR